MFRYADPAVCPRCRRQLGGAPDCLSCGIDLTGPPAARVFEALSHADRLVAGLPLLSPERTPERPPERVHETAPVAMSRRALSGASVPKILLGLGALCLLVASLVFLAVAWAALGVGGRTGVLAGFTVAASVLMVWVARRGLRAGAEAFSAVVLGLLAIDLAGAREAGWLGSIADAWFVVLAGAVIAVAGSAIAFWSRTTSVSRLLGAEAIAVLAVAATAAGAADAIVADDAQAALVATLVCLAGAATGHRLRLRVVAVGCLIEATVAWAGLAGSAALRLSPPTVEHVWADLAAWPTLVAAALAGLVAAVRSLPSWARVSALAASLVMATLAVTAVAFDESTTTLALVELGVIATCSVLAVVLPRPWSRAVVVPSSIAAYALAISVLQLCGAAVAALVPDEVWTAALLDGVDAPDTPWTWPLLLPVGVAGITATVATGLHLASGSWRRVLVPGLGAALAATAMVPALYGAPLVVAVSALALVAAALGASTLVVDDRVLGVVAVSMTALALMAALPSPWTTAGVLAMVLAGALVAERRPEERIGPAGRTCVPFAAAGLLWTLGHLAGLSLTWQALPVVAILGLAVVLRPGPEREVPYGLAAAVAVAGSVAWDGGVDQTWAAVYLTVGGVVVTISALVNPSRRGLSRWGLGFFTAAQWVRLEQLGVDTVEAYTLPLALVLLALGSVSLIRGEQSSVRTLGPGLGLALVPTLLQVLVEPVGTRAVLLGIACVVLISIGLARNLAAPLVAGAAVGALVVLREGTLAQALPQWAIIGLAGVGLTVVGITWEQRLQELRRASAYVRSLR